MTEEEFYQSDAWRAMTRKVYKRYGRKCHGTGLTEKDGITLSVDHIKPRSRYPRLALDISNLQVLQLGLNKTKGLREWNFLPLKWRIYYKLKKLLKTLIIAVLVFLALAVIQATRPENAANPLSFLQESSSIPLNEAADSLDLTRLKLEFCLSDTVINQPQLAKYLSQFCKLPEPAESQPDSSQ